MNKKSSIKYNGDTYIVKSQYDYDLYAIKLNKKQLQRQIEIMERYFKLICDIGYDYDGCNSVESLKALVDELVHLASLGKACNDKETIFEDGKGMKANILGEIILKKVENE